MLMFNLLIEIVVFTAFCSGEVIEKEGSHWTQMEQSAFPEEGKFYCGDCCGQHLAWKACTDQWKDDPPGCINWVQCFQKECRVRFRSFLEICFTFLCFTKHSTSKFE